MKRPRFSSFALKADFWASADGFDHEPDEPDRRAGDRPGPEVGSIVPAEEVGDREHDHGDRDRLQQPEPGEAQRPVPHLVEAMVDLDPQDAAEQVAAEACCPDEDEERGDELNRLVRAQEGEHDREHREGEAVGEVGDDVGLARRRDREEGGVDRQGDEEGEEDRHGATIVQASESN